MSAPTQIATTGGSRLAAQIEKPLHFDDPMTDLAFEENIRAMGQARWKAVCTVKCFKFGSHPEGIVSSYMERCKR